MFDQIKFVVDLQRVADILQHYNNQEGLDLLKRYYILPRESQINNNNNNATTTKKSLIPKSKETDFDKPYEKNVTGTKIPLINNSSKSAMTLGKKQRDSEYKIELSHENCIGKFKIYNGNELISEQEFTSSIEDLAEITALSKGIEELIKTKAHNPQIYYTQDIVSEYLASDCNKPGAKNLKIGIKKLGDNCKLIAA